MSEKPESSLQDQQSNNIVAGIPIKKRLLAWTRSLSPPSGVVSCKTEGSESSTKNPILSETDPTKVKKARKHSFEPAIDIRSVLPRSQHETVGRGGLNLVSGQDKEAGKIEEPIIDNGSMFPQGLLSEFGVPPHLAAGEGNAEDKVILNSKPALPGARKMEEPAIEKRSVSPQESLPKVRVPPYPSAVKRNADGKIIPNSDSTWQGASKSIVSTGTSLARPLMEDGVTPPSTMLSGLFNDGRHLDGISVKVGKMYSCSHSPALVGQYSQLGKQSDSEKAKPCHKNRLNWDLNTVMEAWEGSSSEPTMNHEDTNVGLVDKCSLAGVHTEADRTDLVVGQTSTVDTDHNPNLPTLSLSTSEHFSSYTSLDLQLRPPCKANLGLNLGVSSHLAELNSIAELSELSLSLSGNTDIDASGSGKPKIFYEKSQNTTIEVNLSSTKIIGSRPVKREPCDGKCYEASNSASSSNMKSAISSNSKITSLSVVKPEPREEPPSQQCCEESRQLLYGEFDKNNSVSSGTYVAENAKAMELFYDHAKIGLVSGITTSADNTSFVTTGVVGMDMNLPSQSLAPDCGSAHYAGRVQNGASESCNENRVSGETSRNLLEFAAAQGKDVNAPCEAFELAAVTSSLPLEHVGSDDKGSGTTNDLSSVIGIMGPNDDKLATHNACVVENNEEKRSSHLFDKSSHHGVTEADEQKVCGETSDAVLGVNEHKTHKSGDVDGIKRPPKEGERDDFEDGEVRDPTLHDEGGDRVLPGEDSSEEREANQLDGSTAVVDVPLKIPLNEGVSDIKVENPEESKNVDDSLCADERDSCISTADNQQEVSAAGCLNVATSKKQVIKTIQKFTVNMVNEKGCETTSNVKRDALAHVDKGSNDKMSSTPDNSKALDKIPERHLPKKDAPLKVSLGRQESGKEKQSRIIKLTSATDRSSHVKVKSIDKKSPLIQPEEDKMTDRPVMRSKAYSRETRDGFCKDRYQKFTSDRNQDQYSGKHRSDLMRMKERGNTHPDGSHYIKNMEAEHVFHRFQKSTGMRYPRHNNSSEMAYIAPDCRVVRKHGEDESSNLSRLPSRRRSPGPVDREGHPVMGVQGAGRSFISPGRCIGRDIPDSLPLNADEKRMRALPDVMGDLPLRAQHRLQFEREENAYIRRERRSLSPRPRRGIPLRFRNECSPHQWSPPRRSPNMYEGHAELGHIRSPPILTHDRMRSPRQRPCFLEDVIVRRPGSPQSFMTRMSDDARELHLRRNDCMRPDRVIERNMQRFDMIDPRETTEEEYLEHLHYNQFCELAGGDEHVDVRRICEERRGFVRPIRQRFNASKDEGSLHNHAGDGPTFRYRPEAMEGFSERGGSRDFNGHMQSRLGNAHDSLRGIDEREQYHGRQGWSEVDFAGVRPKRRRM